MLRKVSSWGMRYDDMLLENKYPYFIGQYITPIETKISVPSRTIIIPVDGLSKEDAMEIVVKAKADFNHNSLGYETGLTGITTINFTKEMWFGKS